MQLQQHDSVHLSSVYITAFLVSILLKENHRIAGNWRFGTTTVVYLTKNGLLASDSSGDFRGGALQCFCPRAPKTLVTPLAKVRGKDKLAPFFRTQCSFFAILNVCSRSFKIKIKTSLKIHTDNVTIHTFAKWQLTTKFLLRVIYSYYSPAAAILLPVILHSSMTMKLSHHFPLLVDINDSLTAMILHK